MSVELSTRERELLEILVSGSSNKEAAKRLGVALRTLELHRQKVMQKLGATSAAQLGYLYAKLTHRREVAA